MRPLESEIGVVLEPDDIVVANNVRAFLKEYYEGGKPVGDRNPYYMAPLQSDDSGNLERDESAACHIIHQANSAVRELRHKYRDRDDALSILMEEGSSGTDLYKSLEADLPIFAEKIRLFGSLATATTHHLEVSQFEYIFRLPAVKPPSQLV